MRTAVLKTLALLFLTTLGFGQEIKNQTEQIKSLKPGNYRKVELIDDKKGGFNYDLYPTPIVLKEVKQDPNFSEHKYFVLEEDGTDYNYVIDNMAFPVTFGKEYFMGNEKLQKKVGYVPREFSKGRTVRASVIDGIIYDYNWKFDAKDKSTHIPYRLLVHESFLKEENGKDSNEKKKKLSLKERMMQKMAGNNPEMKAALYVNNKLRDMNAAQIGQDYIQAALAQQKEVEPKWLADKNNARRVKLLDDRRELMYKAMKKYNDDLMDTPEWRRIQENNRLANAAAAKNSVTIKNGFGKDVYVYEEGSMNGTRINAGSTGTFSCSSSYYYAFNGNAGTRGGNAGPKAYSANSSCGSTVTIQ
ncbi:hypothetical protein GCM10009117_19860 [Gangjinia marincola]|uniref:Uncharacterized protein n=1 Tax=Gangjinia marincola TaxID=578463 RepID=A0ABN1MI57_9FLAO